MGYSHNYNWNRIVDGSDATMLTGVASQSVVGGISGLDGVAASVLHDVRPTTP